MGIVYSILKEFLALGVSAAPFFMIGAVFAAFLKSSLNIGSLERFLNKGGMSIIGAAIFGALLPGCSCSTIPMAAGLKKKGAGLGVLVSFILVGSLLAPHTVILTYSMLGWKFAVARVACSLCGAIALGFVYSYLENKKVKGFTFLDGLVSDPIKHSAYCEDTACSTGFWPSLTQIIRNLAKYFLLGLLIASALTVLVPHDFVQRYIGSSGLFSYFAAALVGIPLYVCEGEEIPLTLGLMKIGIGPGPAMTFLLASVGTCIPTIIMAQKVIGKRPTFFYVVYWFVFAILSGLVIEWIY